jgi:hypothetical protein
MRVCEAKRKGACPSADFKEVEGAMECDDIGGNATTAVRGVRPGCELGSWAIAGVNHGILQHRASFSHAPFGVTLFLHCIGMIFGVLPGVDQHSGADTDLIAFLEFVFLDLCVVHVETVGRLQFSDYVIIALHPNQEMPPGYLCVQKLDFL